VDAGGAASAAIGAAGEAVAGALVTGAAVEAAGGAGALGTGADGAEGVVHPGEARGLVVSCRLRARRSHLIRVPIAFFWICVICPGS
jgi:hypothetical protein